MSRTILHFDLDTFFVSCERLENPALIGKPVLVGGTSERGVVAGCSYEARAYGIHSAMPMRTARQLCPHAIVIRGESSIYARFSDQVTDIIADAAPLYEKASIDEFYLDVSGMDRYIGTYRWAQELRQKIIRETRLPISFGLANSKVVAKIGTGQSKPNGFMQVMPGSEKQFLAPLSIRKIPMVGEQTFRLLRSMGILHIHTLQQMPKDMMEALLGKNGALLWERANGIDHTPVIAYHQRKSISLERTFEQDTMDVRRLRSLISAMAENLAYQLRNGHKLTACVTVRIRYSDFRTESKQISLPPTASDKILLRTTLQLFDSLYSRRVMLRLVGVRFSHLISGQSQISLFDDTRRELELLQAMDSIRNRFGQDAVKRAVAMGSKNIGRSNPFNGSPPIIPAHRRQ